MFSRMNNDAAPNVLLIMCDQLSANVLGCYGGQVPTPNIDRLAEEGVLFTSAMCTTPFCSPSRASIITGKYPHSHGILTNVNRRDYPAIPAPPTQQGIAMSDTTTEGVLAGRGYRTHHYGKWHLMDDDLPYYTDMFGEHHEYATVMGEVFDVVREQSAQTWMDWYGWALPVAVDERLAAACDAMGDAWQNRRLSDFITKMGRLRLPVEEVFDVQVADRTRAALRAADTAPFMITCSFNYPHDPNVVPSPYYETFSPDALDLPENVEAREARFEKDWSREIVRSLGEPGLREFMRVYHASVKLIDDQVGRVLNELDAQGLADNTVVVFTSDHGDMAGGHGMVWKSTSAFYEEVARVPLIIRYPHAVRPGQMQMPVSVADLMPTLLDLTGAPVPKGTEGHSLAPYLTGVKPEGSAPAYRVCERLVANADHTRAFRPQRRGVFMVRAAGSKYCRYAGGEEFLYDLTRDPGETENVSGNPEYSAVEAEFRAHLDSWLDAHDLSCPH